MSNELLMWRSQRKREDGASAVEYGLLVALIAAVIVLAVFALGFIIKGAFNQTCEAMNDPGPISGSCAS